MTYQRDNIAAMQGYSWGEQPDDSETLKLNTNENPHPPSPRVAEALANIDANALRTYPQPTADPLRDQLAELHRVDRSNIVIHQEETVVFPVQKRGAGFETDQQRPFLVRWLNSAPWNDRHGQHRQ